MTFVFWAVITVLLGTSAFYGISAESQRRSVHKAVSYTHLRAHETVLDIVCRLLLEKKN